MDDVLQQAADAFIVALNERNQRRSDETDARRELDTATAKLADAQHAVEVATVTLNTKREAVIAAVNELSA